MKTLKTLVLFEAATNFNINMGCDFNQAVFDNDLDLNKAAYIAVKNILTRFYTSFYDSSNEDYRDLEECHEDYLKLFCVDFADYERLQRLKFNKERNQLPDTPKLPTKDDIKNFVMHMLEVLKNTSVEDNKSIDDLVNEFNWNNKNPFLFVLKINRNIALNDPKLFVKYNQNPYGYSY